MKRFDLASLLAAACLLGGVTTAVAADQVSGTVDSITATRLVVAGTSYDIERDTSLEDLGGSRVGLQEIRPGTPVQLDIDDDGHLVTARFTLVR